jgi:hypothetical protein
MKTPTRTAVVFLSVASFTSFAKPGLAEEPSAGGKVEIKDNYILIHPGAKLSKADAAALNSVLKKYDKSLYKIEVYQKGKVVKTVGSLSDMRIDQKTAADLTEAKTKGLSERAIQLIAPSGPQAPTGPVPSGPQTPAGPVPSGPQAPTGPVPSGPQAPTGPVPSGPQAPAGPVPSGPQVPAGPVPSGPQTSTAPVPSGPQTQKPAPSASAKQMAEFMERLKPILEKYSK